MSCVQQEHKTIRNARVAQLVERDLAKVEAAGSSPVSRFFHAKGYPKGYPFLHEMSPDGLKQDSENPVRGLRGPKVLFGRRSIKRNVKKNV